MISDPLDIALREVAETKYLLQAFITSSESFDHLRAKATLQDFCTCDTPIADEDLASFSLYSAVHCS